MLRRALAAVVGTLSVAVPIATTAVVVGVGRDAHTAARAQGAIPIASASLTQDGRQLVWRVVATEPFTPSSLAGARRSVCLVIARAKRVVAVGELCVGVSGRRADAKLRYIPVKGVAHAVPATVTQRSADELTASFLPGSIGVAYRPLRWQVLSTSLTAACAPPIAGAGCVYALPGRPALAKLHLPRLVGCLPTGPKFVYSGPSNVRAVALTFDDGPWVQTPQLLRTLEREHVPATFFEIGRQIAQYGQGGAIERRMLADGDMIGDHTWNHRYVAGGGAYAAVEIGAAAAAIRKATGGFEPCLFRAPYGAVSPALLTLTRRMGFTTIQWNVDPRDWARPGVGEIEHNIITNARNGAIIEEHDGGGDRSQTIAALPKVIRALRARGYKFETLTEMLGYKLIYR